MEFIPKREPQKIPLQVYESSIPNEGKWEYSGGQLLFTDEEMRKLILMIVGSVGLEKFVDEILPEKSRRELKNLLSREG
jgi:hypothetical protein